MEDDRSPRPRRRPAPRPAQRPSLLALRGVGRVLALGAGAAVRRSGATPATPVPTPALPVPFHPTRKAGLHVGAVRRRVVPREAWTLEEALVEAPVLAAGAARAFFASTTAHSPAASLLGASVTGMLAAYWVLELVHALLWPACFALLGLMVFAPGFARWLLADILPSATVGFCRAVRMCRLAVEAAAAGEAEEAEGCMLADAVAAGVCASKSDIALEVCGAAPRGDAPSLVLPVEALAMLADAFPLGDAASVPETSCRLPPRPSARDSSPARTSTFAPTMRCTSPLTQVTEDTFHPRPSVPRSADTARSPLHSFASEDSPLIVHSSSN